MTKRTTDLLERLLWTVIAAVATNLSSVGVLGIAAWKGAAMAGINGAVTFVLVIARQRLAGLPNPGDGLPGLPADDQGQTLSGVLVALILLVILLILLGAIPAPHR